MERVYYPVAEQAVAPLIVASPPVAVPYQPPVQQQQLIKPQLQQQQAYVAWGQDSPVNFTAHNKICNTKINWDLGSILGWIGHILLWILQVLIGLAIAWFALNMILKYFGKPTVSFGLVWWAFALAIGAKVALNM
ncbi:hypothetical protein ml_417 [Mollivirus sibericum]|uniref:hypothetical protein n=1 Tax=Mollivirus sibericum TaxID=1678078 RepID=UPI0006B2E26E|nr:hypothetical protein ml_417 [Mollivirus sibericum]ALD62219.1 hypothetical protein ml_417 [Mollivirus sibericum]